MFKVLDPKHRRKSHQTGIYLNIFQPSHDRQLAMMCRNMKAEGLIKDTFVNMRCLTVVVPNGSGNKVMIYNASDLVQFAGGRNIAEFGEGYSRS